MTKSDQSSTSKMCLVCQKQFDASVVVCPHDRSNLVRIGQEDNFIGKVINDKYKILAKIGQGGMGTVYVAEQLGLGRQVAVKILKAQLSEDKVSVQRFQQEAGTSADLSHENLIHLFDYGTFEGRQPYLILEYLEGESLAEMLRREGPLNPVRCLRIFEQVMDGLHYAHNKGVVHRDIKPSNIILLRDENGDEKVKIVDFGLAKLMPWSGKESQHLTKTGEVFGSPIYMSPEQCMGKKLEPSSDIYSLGVTLFETLVGKPPFKGKNVVETASQHMHAPPPTFDSIRPDLNLSENLQAVINKALEKEPVKRYLDLTKFREALNQAINGPGANSGIRIGPPPAPSADATQPVKRSDLENYKPTTGTHPKKGEQLRQAQSKSAIHPGIIAAAIAVIAIGGGGAWYVTSQGKQSSTPAPAVQHGYVSYVNADGRLYHLAIKGQPVQKIEMSVDTGEYRLGREASLQPDTTVELGKDGTIGSALSTLNNFYAYTGDTNSAYDLFSDKGKAQYGSKNGFGAELKKEQYVGYSRIKAPYGNTVGDELQNFSKIPNYIKLLKGVKIVNQEEHKAELLVDQSAFLSKSTHPYKKFSFVKGRQDMLIDSMAKSDQAEWNKY